MGRISAAIFDLFGTLVPPYRHHEVLAEMAGVLRVDPARFMTVFAEETSEARETGQATLEETLRDVCRRLGEAAADARIAEAVDIRRRFTRASLAPRDDALQALTELKGDGFAIAVISDCCQAVSELWESAALAAYVDAAILSFRVGVRKPDRRIYRLACTALSVEPSRCVYVGDGGHHELAGAARAGMDAVLLRIESEMDLDPYRPEARSWDGPWVGSLRQLVQAVKRGDRPTRHWS